MCKSLFWPHNNTSSAHTLQSHDTINLTAFEFLYKIKIKSPTLSTDAPRLNNQGNESVVNVLVITVERTVSVEPNRVIDI